MPYENHLIAASKFKFECKGGCGHLSPACLCTGTAQGRSFARNALVRWNSLDSLGLVVRFDSSSQFFPGGDTRAVVIQGRDLGYLATFRVVPRVVDSTVLYLVAFGPRTLTVTSLCRI